MQLMTARLCLDCSEVHDQQQCPICASKAFTYMTRWVPAPERRMKPREPANPELDVYRRLVGDGAKPVGKAMRVGAVGLTAVGIVGWLWKTANRAADDKKTTS